MPLVARRNNRIQRQTFKALPVGATYYLNAGGTGPFLKIGQRARLTADTFPTASSGTAITDVSVLTKRVGKFYLGQKAV